MEPAIKDICSVINIDICSANFCRRSKYPIIGLGMKITKKYHGMELPAKVKIAVAGCKNSCTNAYSKDIGVLPDIDGKLFIVIGGKSGLKQRKYDLLADNLNERDVMLIIGKLLNYYKINALEGERLSSFIDRLSIEKIKEDILIKLK